MTEQYPGTTLEFENVCMSDEDAGCARDTGSIRAAGHSTLRLPLNMYIKPPTNNQNASSKLTPTFPAAHQLPPSKSGAARRQPRH